MLIEPLKSIRYTGKVVNTERRDFSQTWIADGFTTISIYGVNNFSFFQTVFVLSFLNPWLCRKFLTKALVIGECRNTPVFYSCFVEKFDFLHSNKLWFLCDNKNTMENLQINGRAIRASLAFLREPVIFLCVCWISNCLQTVTKYKTYNSHKFCVEFIR